MSAPTGDLGLLAVHAATRYALTKSGRILHWTDPKRSPGPRFAIAGCAQGNVILIGHDVGEETARALLALAAGEPPFCEPGGAPVHLDEYIQLLAREAPVEKREPDGLLYSFPERLAYEHGAELVSSETPRGRRFLDGLPPGRQFAGWSHPVRGHIWAPWCLALHDGEIASIVETVATGAAGAECGVTTAPALRGRGFAAAAAAGWAALPPLRGRALFYGTNLSNRSSRRVTERLGLRLIGLIFSLT
jgi:hypothetical protein